MPIAVAVQSNAMFPVSYNPAISQCFYTLLLLLFFYLRRFSVQMLRVNESVWWPKLCQYVTRIKSISLINKTTHNISKNFRTIRINFYIGERRDEFRLIIDVKVIITRFIIFSKSHSNIVFRRLFFGHRFSLLAA